MGGWGYKKKKKNNIPVSHICNRTTVSVSVSITRLVIMLAPTVEVIWAGLKAPLQKRVTRDVLPTPWEPRTTIFASREDDIIVVGDSVGVVVVVVFVLICFLYLFRLAIGVKRVGLSSF